MKTLYQLLESAHIKVAWRDDSFSHERGTYYDEHAELDDISNVSGLIIDTEIPVRIEHIHEIGGCDWEPIDEEDRWHKCGTSCRKYLITVNWILSNAIESDRMEPNGYWVTYTPGETKVCLVE